jgi:ubiquinone/menaquinone biosynthesis C-methylase UbiE
MEWNLIAEDWDRKRSKPWRALEDFIDFLKNENIEFKGINVDIGCGNGRNFILFNGNNSKIIGIDKSIDLLKKAKKKRDEKGFSDNLNANKVDLILADMQFLPIRKNSIHNIFSIAALHHIKTSRNRQMVISEIYRILKISGLLLITVWRKWQERFRKHFIIDFLKRMLSKKFRKSQKELGLPEFGDKFVSWTLPQKNETVNRFYHLFSKREIFSLLKRFSIKEFKKMGGSTGKDNFFILTKKGRIK